MVNLIRGTGNNTNERGNKLTTEEALNIMANHEDDKRDYSVNGLLEGMKLLENHNMGKDYSAQHDILYVCDFETTVATMSKDEIIQLVKWGWHEEEDAWCVCT